ncbi:hypothetical protein ACWGOQ_0023625 [Aquimarina sp. M1]
MRIVVIGSGIGGSAIAIGLAVRQQDIPVLKKQASTTGIPLCLANVTTISNEILAY